MSYYYDSELDRKSSRGMIYENEELRLRTININAEVERGQSDIKRLRRENEQLRREIWTLRDECDRLNKRVKTKLSEYEHGGCSARASGGSGGCTRRGSNGACDGMHSQSNSEDSDSCDTCRGDLDEPCNEECCQERCKQPIVEEPVETQSGNMLVNNVGPITVPNCEEPLGPHSNFDHLSVVSEETLSSSDVLAPPQSEHLLGYNRDNNSSPHSIQSLIGPLTPLTPIELVANQLNDLQAVVPPLSYFENIVQQQHMGSNIGQTPASSSNDVTMRHTNGWDYNIESPFAQRKGHNKGPPAPAGNAVAHLRSPNLPPRHTHVPALTTFGPTNTNISAGINTTDSTKPAEIMAHTPARPSNIETVAITTMPTNVPAIAPTILNSPKHFFAPLKPRLKLNTTLANKMLVAASVPAVPPTTATTMSSSNAVATVPQICEPPDIFVANALASPYQRQPMPAATAAPVTATKTMKTTTGESTIAASPVSSQRTTSQVSARQSCRRHQQHQQHKRHRQHQQQQQRLLLLLHEQQQRLLRQQIIEPIRTSFVAADTVDGVDVDTTSKTTGTATATATLTTTARTIIPTDIYALPINIKCLTLQQQLTAYVQQLSLPCVVTTSASTATTETTPIQVVQSNIFFTKPNEPIYATAQKRCTSLISATALTKPLMTATTHTTKTTQCTTQLLPDTNNITNINTTTTNVTTKDGGVQTDSVNLKSILNEIETISEDILAIQLEKNKSRENLTNADAPGAGNKSLQQQNKNKKPYRSEMNLMLSYNGTNPKITPAITATGTQTSLSSGSSHSARRTRSLEREQTESPSPNVPDPMAPFPDNRTYIGFEQYDQGVIVMKTAPTGLAAPTQKPPLPPPPSQLVAGGIGAEGTVFGSSNLPQKPPPPAPPTRMYPPPLNIRGAALTRAASAGTPPVEKAPSQTSLVHGLAPNKSHLYTAIATAAAKRAQFRAAPSHMTRSLDTEFMAAHDGVTEADSPQNVVDENNQITEIIRRKTRRVSIVCGDSNAPTTPERSSPVKTPVQTTATVTGPLIMHPAMNPATGSCADLSTALSNPTLKHLKQSSHSTPNSPHSSRRTHEQAHNEAASASAGSTPHHTGGPRNAHHATSTANGISNGVPTQQRKNSQDSGIHANSAVDLDAAAATAARSKCSRRHSDGTVAGGGGGGGGQRNSGGSHYHHHHHHQPHSSTILGHNPHHSHHSHQDSNHETGTSISDRNSNSLASSRESSTSFSMRSQRRKISISSHAGGKIPWCGCWGNGCL